MRLWRICREPFADQPLGGRGGLVAGGRWHTRGSRVVYLAEALSLAAMELLMHVSRATAPDDLVQISVEVPDTIAVRAVGDHELPPRWRATPAPPELRRIGDRWLADGRTALLKVRSAVVPSEYNFLLNPAHADAARVQVVATEPFTFDARVWS